MLFTSRVCPAPDCIHRSQSSCFFFSMAGTALCCSCTKYLSPLRENGLHIVVGEGVRQRCQHAQWVKGVNFKTRAKSGSFLLERMISVDSRVYRHIGAWRKIYHLLCIVLFIISRQDQ